VGHPVGGSAELDSFDSRSQLGRSLQILAHNLASYEPRSTMPQPIRPGNHTTTLRLSGEAWRMTEDNLKVIGKADSPTSRHILPKQQYFKPKLIAITCSPTLSWRQKMTKKMKMKIASGHHRCTNHSQSNPL
jgi:hypothetical protein